MSNLTDYRDLILTNLEAVVAAEHVIDFSNQRDDDTAKNSTILNAICLDAAARCQMYLGTTVDGSNHHDVVLGTRMALLLANTEYALNVTDLGMARAAGIIAELKEEAMRRRQSADYISHAEEDFDGSTTGNPNLDGMYSELTWDNES